MTFATEIDYEALLQASLKMMMVKVLQQVADEGLPGDHHFYIGFDTRHVAVRISDRIKGQYPEEMVIVLRHQYENLIVDEHSFSVDLFFGGVRETLKIPFDAINRFEDPSKNFALQFVSHEIKLDENDLNSLEDELLDDLESGSDVDEGVAKFPKKPVVESSKADETISEADDAASKVVSLDKFRKS